MHASDVIHPLLHATAAAVQYPLKLKSSKKKKKKEIRSVTHHHYEAFVFLEARAVEEPPTCRHAHTHTLFSMEKTDLSEHFVTKQREKSTCNCFFGVDIAKKKKHQINTLILCF